MIALVMGLIVYIFLRSYFPEPYLAYFVSIAIGVTLMSISFFFQNKYQEERWGIPNPFVLKPAKSLSSFFFTASIPLVIIPVMILAFF